MIWKLVKAHSWKSSVIYFMIVAVGLSVSNRALQPLIMLGPFLALLLLKIRWLHLLLGLLVFGWSSMIFLAYLSDAFKIQAYNSKSLGFLIGGGSIVLLSLIMSMIWLSNFPIRSENGHDDNLIDAR